jgi:alpha-tubulin suppressor-like RCC1 family protein
VTLTTRAGIIALTLAAAPILAGCPEKRCEPANASRACACPEAVSGLQTCWARGAWSACLGCPPRVPAAGIVVDDFTGCTWLVDGTVKCWGDNQYGAVGVERPDWVEDPVALVGIIDAVSGSLGSSSACAVLSDGTARCWGLRAFGLLGDSSSCVGPHWTEFASLPVEVLGLREARKIVSGDLFKCALTEVGKVSCWGDGRNGALGIGEVQPCPDDDTWQWSPMPVDASGIADAVDLAAGGEVCAVHADATVSCWGNGIKVPTKVPALSGVAQLALGSHGHSCGRYPEGHVQCWGSNDRGQLGDGTTLAHAEPEPVTGLSDVVDLAVAGARTCAVRSSGELWCWGECGDPPEAPPCADQLVPIRVLGLEGVTRIALGDYAHGCVVHSAGAVSCWYGIPGSEEPEPLAL